MLEKSTSTLISFVAAATAGFLFIGFVTFAILQDRSAVLVYLRDPAAHFKFSPFAGLVSNSGILTTIATAAVCLFAAAHGKTETTLLRAIGLFSLVLGLDDLLMLHEDTLPNRLGLPETLAYVCYVLAALYIAIRFRLPLRRAPLSGLILAMGLLAASFAVDALTAFGNVQTVVEDGLKFVGLVVWSAYWINRAGQDLRHQAAMSKG